MMANNLQIPLNAIVEIFLIDEGKAYDITHPIHIHGYSPYIVATERHAAEPEKYFGRQGAGNVMKYNGKNM